jgi:predicted amidohydrolase
MKVASVQFQHRAGDKSYNHQVVRQFVQQAARQDVKLIVFPECCLSGYWHLRNLGRKELLDLAESVPESPLCQEVATLASQYAMTIGVGLVEVTADGVLYNAYYVVNEDGSWANHRKLHCFISPHMQSGSEYTVFTGPGDHKLGILTCYDNNIGENVRATALLGAEVLLAPHQTGGCNSGSPFAMGVIDTQLWERKEECREQLEVEFRGDKGRGWLLRWLPARAHDNGLFVLFSNGVGRDDDEVRTGNAMILDPYGQILEETSAAEDRMITANLDFSLRDRCTGVRWIRTRRPELYGIISQATGCEEDTRQVRFEHLEKQGEIE